MKKKSGTGKFIRAIAILLVIILALPQNPLVEIFDAGLVKAHADIAKYDPSMYIELTAFKNTLVITPEVIGDYRAGNLDPTGTLTYKYCIGTEVLSPEWKTIASGQSLTEPYYWDFSEAGIQGKEITINVCYSGDDNYNSIVVNEFTSITKPVVNSVSEITRNGSEYKFTINGSKYICYYYLLTPYKADGVYDLDEVEIKNKAREYSEYYYEDNNTYFGFDEVAADPDATEIIKEVTVDGTDFDPGFYVLLLVLSDANGNLCDKVITSPFRTSITFTADDIAASCDTGLVYKGEDIIPTVTLTAKDNTDTLRKKETTTWLSKVKAETTNPLTFAFLRTNEWDGTETTNVASGPAITLAGTYEIYATGTYDGDTITSECLGTVEVARDKAVPSVNIASDVSILDKKAELSVELTGVKTYSTPTGGTVDYLYSTDDGSTWIAIAEAQEITYTYTWSIPDDLMSEKVKLKAVYSGDDEYYTAESKVQTVDFTLTERYTEADLTAAIDKDAEYEYTGAPQTPEVILSVITADTGRKANIEGWLNDAKNNKYLIFSFKQIKDGNGTAVTTAKTSETITDAGSYEIFVSDKRASNLIKNVSLGTIEVKKAEQEAPDTDPAIIATASEDRLSYTLSADISGVQNATGKTVEYSTDGVNYGTENTYIVSKQEGTQETVSFKVRFAATKNYNESEAVTAEFKADVSEKPKITEETEFEETFTVTIAANSIDDEIYYTLDGTTPSLNGDMAYGAFITTIDKTTTVSAMVVGKDKFLGPVATATYTKKAEEKNPSPSPADNPSPTPADEPSGIPTQDPSTNNEEKTIVITSSSETNKLLVAETESETINLMAVLKASGIDNRAILWSVSTPGIVSLDTYYSKSKEAINVTAKKVGTVKITAMAEADRSIKDDIEITVENKHNHAYTVNFNWIAVAYAAANTKVEATATCSVGSETVPVTDLTLTNKMVGTTIEYTASAKDPDGKIYYSYKNVDEKGVVRDGRAGQVLSGDLVIVGLEVEYPYTGKKITPDFYVMDGDVVLAKGGDYSVKYTNNKNVGEATIEISGKGNYKDKNAVAKFKIYDPFQRAKDEGVTLAAGVKSIAKIQGSFVYNGKAQYPATITVNLNTKPKSTLTLTHEGDGVYTNEGDATVVISVVNNVNKGTAVVAAVGADGKVKTKTFSIKAAEISSAKVIEGLEAAYSSKGAIPAGLEVNWKNVDEEEVDLIAKQDFTVKYSNNKAVGTGKIKLTGKGNFKGKLESSFAIKPLEVDEIDAIEAFDKVKAGKLKVTVLDKQGFEVPDKKLSVTVLNEEGTAIDGKTKLTAGTKITVVVKSADPASVVIAEDGISKDAVVGTKMGSVKVDAKKLTKTYTGEAIELTEEDMGSVNVTYKKNPLVYGEDFVIIGYANNVNKGSMTVTIAGTGEDNGRGVFSSTKTFKVKIVPKSFQ